MEGQALFDKVVTLLGVSAVLAPGLVRRALLDGKVQVENATPSDYRAALPRILARLRAYMPEEEAQRRARRIASTLSQIEATKTMDDDDGDHSLIGRVSEALRGGAPSAATPSEGVSRRPMTPSAAVSPQSGERSLDFDDDEPTVMGRRYTAHELEVLRRASSAGSDGNGGRDKDR